jgi:hypothetical protein
MIRLPAWAVVLIFLTCWPAAVLADESTYSASNPDGRLTLTSEPCLVHPWLNGWQVARWMWKGKPYEACWRLQNDGGDKKLVVVLDSNGEVVTVDPRQFTRDAPI